MNSRTRELLSDQAVFNVNSLINSQCGLNDVSIIEQSNKEGKEVISTLSSWINGEGAEFKLQMDFRFDPSCPGKIWVDYRSQPSIVNGRILDEYGFKLPSYRYRRLGWDLLMQLDTQTLEKKVSELHSRIH
jgi:hypothetical protein